MKKMKKIIFFAVFGLIGYCINIINVNAADCNGVEIGRNCITYCSSSTNAEMQDVLKKGVAVSAEAYGAKNYEYNYKFYIGGNNNQKADYYLYFNGQYLCKNDKSKYCNIKYTNENKNQRIYYFKTNSNGSCYIGSAKFTEVVTGSNICPSPTDKNALVNVGTSAKLNKNFDNGTFTVKYEHVDGYKAEVKKYNKNTETWEVVSGCGQTSCYLGSQIGTGTVSYKIVYYVDNEENKCDSQPVKQIKFEDIPKFKLNPYIEQGSCDGYNELNNALQGVISKCKHKYVTSDTSNPSKQQLSKVKKLIKKAKELNKNLENFSEYGNSSLKKYIDNPNLLDVKRPTIDTQYCQFNPNKNKISKKTYTTEVGLSKNAAKYFKMVCQESISGDYDSPKLVSNNGGGFGYDVNINHDVSCYLTFKDKDILNNLLKLEECDYNAYVTGDPDGTNTSGGVIGAGPTEEFDACISKCDNGKYTQACINSCGAKTKDKKVQLDFTSTAFINSSIKKMNSSPPANAERWTKPWCSYGPYHATKDDGSTYANPGYMRCIYSAASNGKIIGKMFTTDNCTAIKEIKVTNPESGKSASASIIGFTDDAQLYTNGIEVNDKGYVSQADCYVADVDKLIEDELNSIEKAFAQAKDDYEQYIGNTKLNVSSVDATYVIHDSSYLYCDNDEEKSIVYKNNSNKNPLIINPETNTKSSANSIPSSLNDLTTTKLSFGFPNTCLKNGKYENKKGCCNTSDGITGGKKFYMSITTDNNINNVYSWPTTDNTNFTDLEKDTINMIRDNINKKVTGSVITYNTDDFKGTEKCEENGYKFKYNIQSSLQNIGVLGNDGGWKVNINCFYGYYDSNIGSCGVTANDVDTDGDGEIDTTVIKETLCNNGDPDKQPDETSKQTTTLVNDYIFRTVDVTNLFNNSSSIPWNWKTSKTTKAATTNLTTRNITYKIDPDTTIKNIQDTGYAYENYRNFHIVMSSNNMRNIRNYNQNNSKITSASCSSKSLGCSNTFIKDYVDTATGDFGVTYNNKRDVK